MNYSFKVEEYIASHPDVLRSGTEVIHTSSVEGIQYMYGDSYEHIQENKAAQAAITAMVEQYDARPADRVIDFNVLPVPRTGRLDAHVQNFGKAAIRVYGFDVALINPDQIALGDTSAENLDKELERLNHSTSSVGVVLVRETALPVALEGSTLGDLYGKLGNLVLPVGFVANRPGVILPEIAQNHMPQVVVQEPLVQVMAV